MGSGGNLPVGPGIWGFIAFFVLAVSLWLLVRNMNSRLRRMAYRDRDEAAARAEADGVDGAAQDAGPDPTRDASAGAENTEAETAEGVSGDDHPAPRAD